MHVEALETLQEIGRQLDRNVFPMVKNGGIVMPSEPAVPSILGKENHHVTGTKRRSAAGSRQRSTGWQGPSRGSWPPGPTTPVVCENLQAKYKDEVDALHEVYPITQLWHQDGDIWLLVRSALLPALSEHAIFLTGISCSQAIVRSWGFWGDYLAAPTWIGPRHTNFPDGSICAFEPSDRTWVMGDPIVTLIDLYTVWAVRHLHLRVFGRWPGYQAVAHPYERILELRTDEYCGCSQSDKLYGECCREKDLRRNRITDAVQFIFRSGGERKPPQAVIGCVRDRKDPRPLGVLLAA